MTFTRCRQLPPRLARRVIMGDVVVTLDKVLSVIEPDKQAELDE